MTSTATPNATSSQAVASGPSRPDLPDGQTIDLFGQVPAPASRSRRPARGSEPMIQGICGRTFIASSVPDGPLSSWESRLRERLGTVGSTESALIWRAKDTPAGRLISRLAVSTRHTNGTASTGSQWSTPRASDGEKGGPNQSFGAGGQPLPAQMHQASPWVTPSARDWKDTPGMATEAGERNRVDQLPRQMAQEPQATWATPRVEAGRALGNAKHITGKRGAGNIEDQLAATAYMPTPTVADVQGGRKARSGKRSGEPLLNGICYGTEPTGPTPNGSSATTAKRGAPNPIFAFWLMGFPAEWISGALAAMRSYRKPRRKS